MNRQLTQTALLLLAASALAERLPAQGAGAAPASTLAVQVTEAESPLPVKDSMLAGRYKLKAAAQCKVLQTMSELIIQKKRADGKTDEVVLENKDDSKNYDPKAMWEVPFAMKAGETREFPFQIGPFAIEAGLKKLGYPTAAAALKAPEVKIVVRVTARAQGAADASGTFDVKVVP